MQTKDRLSSSRHVSESDGAKKDVRKKLMPGDMYKVYFWQKCAICITTGFYIIPWIKI